MALVACPQCGEQVSNDAPICPQCGGRRPAAETLATKPDSTARWFVYSTLGIVALVALALFAHSFVPPKDAPTPPKNELCESDWTKCADNAEIVRSYKGWLDVQVACRIAAIETAKYGTPTWPFVPFQGFSEGKTYVAVRGGRGDRARGEISQRDWSDGPFAGGLHVRSSDTARC